jgi:hypothetical protein
MDEKDPWGPFLSSAAYAIRSTFHTTLKATPGKLVFGRGMVLPIKFMADWGEIVLNYSHSRNPSYARTRKHGQIQAPREPPN